MCECVWCGDEGLKSFRAIEKFVGGGGRPNLVLAQVQVFCPGPGPSPDLTGLDWTGLDLT